jgi:hypothetical protein
LGRQVEKGKIRRIFDGVYEKPVFSILLQEYVPVNPEMVAYALARNYHWTISPCGDVALRKLWLPLYPFFPDCTFLDEVNMILGTHSKMVEKYGCRAAKG